MNRKTGDLADQRVQDELDVFGRNPFDGFLDDMITILIFDALEHFMFELLDQLRLLVGQNVLECLSSSALLSQYGGK